MTNDRRQALAAFQRLADDLGLDIEVTAQAEGYRVTGLSPGDVEYTSASWDGADAEASYPNPTDDDVDLDVLADHYMFAPSTLSADDPPPKSAFKAPMRMGPGGPVNTTALTSIIGAINGARGGFDDVSRDVLEDGYDWAVQGLVEAGEYDGADDAPDFEPANASVADLDANADFDIEYKTDLAAEAVGTISVDVQATDTLDAESAQDLDGSLGGIIWGAGDHDLSLGGNATQVRVPQETIPPTFEALQESVASGDVTLGFDHVDDESVAAKTGIVDIGTADDVRLSADGQYIVLTDSSLTNDQAAAAAESGDFDDLDWSVVADVAVRRDQEGAPVIEDDRVVLDATRIRRIDAVDTGAVDAASIERDTAALPDLTDEAQVVQDAAADLKQTNQAVAALQAASTAITEHMSNNDFDPDVDGDVPDDVQDQLDAAARIIDDKQDELDTAKARATGFDRLLTAHGLDADDFETPADAAQAVIDEQTESTRQEIAELEATTLGAYDVDDVDARAQELAGNDPDDLKNTLNARKAEAYESQQKRQQKGRATARGDETGRADFSGGSGAGGNADADEIALGAMDGADRIEAEANGESPAEYVRQEYGVVASQHDASDDLHREIMDAIDGDDA